MADGLLGANESRRAGRATDAGCGAGTGAPAGTQAQAAARSAAAGTGAGRPAAAAAAGALIRRCGFFEGRGNLEGIYAAVAYSLSDNVIGTIRYGYANRINGKLGTGGNNQDIPQINPVDKYSILQLDLTLRF